MEYFVLKRIRSVVERMEFISDRTSFITLKGWWCDIIVVNSNAPSEYKDDSMKTMQNDVPCGHRSGRRSKKKWRDEHLEARIGIKMFMI